MISRNPEFSSPDAITVTSYKAAVEEATNYIGEYPEEVFVIGGGQIYEQTIEQMDRVYLTLIQKKYTGETTYPLKRLKKFRLGTRRDRIEPIPFSFLTYMNWFNRPF